MEAFSGSVGKYSDEEICNRIGGCQQLKSLKSITSALSDLVNAQRQYTSEIAEVIRRDPSLTTRLLRLVNSVFFGLGQKVTSVEDAIIYLGVRQIRELAMATPVIEDFDSFAGAGQEEEVDVNWEAFWRHSIAVAMVGRDLIRIANLSVAGEADYVVGLIHNVGKMVMRTAFKDEFRELMQGEYGSAKEVCEAEEALIGWDHGRIGGYYLHMHKMSSDLVEGATFHNHPNLGDEQGHKIGAIVKIADAMVRSVGIYGIEGEFGVEEDSWCDFEFWGELFDDEDYTVKYELASLKHTLKRLPEVIEGMVN